MQCLCRYYFRPLHEQFTPKGNMFCEKLELLVKITHEKFGYYLTILSTTTKKENKGKFVISHRNKKLNFPQVLRSNK